VLCWHSCAGQLLETELEYKFLHRRLIGIYNQKSNFVHDPLLNPRLKISDCRMDVLSQTRVASPLDRNVEVPPSLKKLWWVEFSDAQQLMDANFQEVTNQLSKLSSIRETNAFHRRQKAALAVEVVSVLGEVECPFALLLPAMPKPKVTEGRLFLKP